MRRNCLRAEVDRQYCRKSGKQLPDWAAYAVDYSTSKGKFKRVCSSATYCAPVQWIHGWCWLTGQAVVIIQTNDSWQEMVVATVYHLSFRRQLVIYLLKGSHCQDCPQIGGGCQANLPDPVRYDGLGHDRVACDQAWCRMCLKNTRAKCVKCNARLHTDKGKDCFKLYHTPDCWRLRTSTLNGRVFFWLTFVCAYLVFVML